MSPFLSGGLESAGPLTLASCSCMLAHGVAGFLKERMFEASDGYRIHVCEMCVRSRFHSSVPRPFRLALTPRICVLRSCGLTAIANLKKQSFECRACKNRTASAFGFVLARLLPRCKLTLSPSLQLRKCTFLTQQVSFAFRFSSLFSRLCRPSGLFNASPTPLADLNAFPHRRALISRAAVNECRLPVRLRGQGVAERRPPGNRRLKSPPASSSSACSIQVVHLSSV